MPDKSGKYTPSAKNIEFKIIPKQNKESTRKFKLEFALKIKGKNLPVKLDLEGFAIIKFPNKFSKDKISEMLLCASFPMLFSTLRGFIFATTLNSPVHVVLPLVNIIESKKDILDISNHKLESKKKDKTQKK